MKRRHAMPFGSTLEDAGVRFRLWAPQAQSVELVYASDGDERIVAMNGATEGWFEAVIPGAKAGACYRYRIDGKIDVPDPASRHQPEDVHGPSMVIDPQSYEWHDASWRGRPWHEIVLYELHVGSYTPQGTFEAAARRLGYLRDIGVTAVELMPLADFPGRRNWGYDGVMLFAPDSRYGRPDDLKRLIDEAHRLGLAVFLDVVYNHFGPDGNYLHVYAHDCFFTRRHHTPWGAAINFDGAGSRIVREFYVHNALYWLEEFHFDGLRLDAVHAICDDSDPDILVELAEAVRRGPGRERQVHLVLENDDNAARYLARAPDGTPRWYDAQWNDDAHHAFHVAITGERDGYYADYADAPARHLARTLTEGYAYQGDYSPSRKHVRGEPSRDLPPEAFVIFLQNHDQIGNRAFGERMAVLAGAEERRAAYALMLLAPSIPLLFMGEELGCSQPFPFFCDFAGELAQAVTAGRRREFASFARFSEAGVESIPDPNADSTFESAVIDWHALARTEHRDWHAFVGRLLDIRHREIVPLMPHILAGSGVHDLLGARAFRLEWALEGRRRLIAVANLGQATLALQQPVSGRTLYALNAAAEERHGVALPSWSVIWSLDDGMTQR